MRRCVVSMTVLSLAVVAIVAGQTTTVNNSRSNIKNNISVTAGPGGKVLCESAGKPCTEQHVQMLSKIYWDQKKSVKALTLAPDGSLNCDGKPCAASHLPDLKTAAAAVKGAGSVGAGPGKAAPPSEK